ncbi:DUF222 domain-containing protein [Georgenia wangjunii]|uniref:DUF222 domain-containing protein n=1 Tax=Georgenia wangjunii TaxID=3117730 RepID=UPI002F2693F2
MTAMPAADGPGGSTELLTAPGEPCGSEPGLRAGRGASFVPPPVDQPARRADHGLAFPAGTAAPSAAHAASTGTGGTTPRTGSGAPAELVAAVLAALVGLREGAPGGSAKDWDRSERESVIGSLDAVIRDATVYRGQVLLAHKEDGAWGSSRDRDFTDWRSRTTGTGRGAAAGELGLAEGLDAMPGVADAVQDGTITLEHARALTRLREHASAEVKDALDGDLGTELLDLAATVPTPELAKTARTRAAAIDAAAAQAGFDAVRARRSFTVRRQGGGRKGEFFLNDVDGTMVDTAIDAIVGTPAKDDTRTREQRRADALVTMAARVLQVGADRNGAQIRPHLALLVTEDTWADVVRHRADLDQVLATPPPGPGEPGHSFYRPRPDETGALAGAANGVGAAGADGDVGGMGTARGRGTAGPVSANAHAGGHGPGGDADRDSGCAGNRDSHGDGTTGGAGGASTDGTWRLPPLGPLPALPDVAPAVLEDGSIVPLTELARIMCDCEMTRIVLDAHGVPLDVGQTQRHYTRELRRTVTTRDRHCRWPGCTLRASWCEVHHITWWSNGGPTSINNGLTLCSYHHHRVHADHIRITTLPGGHAFHDRHGTHIDTTTHERPPKRSRRVTTGEPDGLTPPRPGCAATSSPSTSRPSTSSTEGTALRTAEGKALPSIVGTPLPTAEGRALPSIVGTAPPAAQETRLPAAGATSPPAAQETRLPAAGATSPPGTEGTELRAPSGIALPAARGTAPPTNASTARPPAKGTTRPDSSGPTSPRRTTTARRPRYEPILWDVGDPPF